MCSAMELYFLSISVEIGFLRWRQLFSIVLRYKVENDFLDTLRVDDDAIGEVLNAEFLFSV